MSPQPDIDWQRFGWDLRDFIDEYYGTYDAVVAAHVGINKGMLSRACNGKKLSAASFLHLCNEIGPEPDRYLKIIDPAPPARREKPRSIADIVKNQTVTALAKRETITRRST